MSDHERLDALHRPARDRAATPAEKATACRLAKALAARIGERRRGSRRKGNDAALPEASRRQTRRIDLLAAPRTRVTCYRQRGHPSCSCRRREGPL